MSEIDELKNVYNLLENSVIVGNDVISNNLHVTYYENGKRVIINYNENDVKYNGYLIPSMSYVVLDRQGGMIQ